MTALVQRDLGEDGADAPSSALGHLPRGTEALHAAIYGNSRLAHAPGPVHFLQNFWGAEFEWSSVREAGARVVRDWMTFYNLREPFNVTLPAPGECDLNMERTTVSAVSNLFIVEAQKAGLRFDRSAVQTAVTARLNAHILMHNRRAGISFPVTGPVEPNVPDPVTRAPSTGAGTGVTPGATSGGTPAGGSRGPSTQLSISIQGNLTAHRNLGTGKNTTDSLGTQITGQVTLQVRQDGRAGVELSIQGGVSFLLANPTGGNVTDLTLSDQPRVTSISNAQVAAQVAWVAPFFQDTLTLQAFGQLVAGVNWDQVEDDTPVALPARAPLVLPATPGPMAQVAAGLQASYIVPGTDRHVQFFVQAQGGVTTSGQGQTADAQISFGFQGVIPGT